MRLVAGDGDLADYVHLLALATPGHTPGHQSVVVGGGDRRVVLGGQRAFTAAELRSATPSPAYLHDPTWRAAAAESLAHLRAHASCLVLLSHDPEVVALVS